MEAFPIFLEEGHYISRVTTRGSGFTFVCRLKDGSYETSNSRDEIIEICAINDSLKDKFIEWWRNAHS